ncbi:MAG: polysaccharide biosynthesis tyrosine autokinase [Kiritimatiellae bacterium]|nr:polysaccharide biosynthesis tyrosine autokinase [Kiritimatiellia bacterium]
MPPQQPQQEQKIDFRIYLGILFFRWKIIVVCFLYCLLGGVLYLNLTPKQYGANCQILIYRDENVALSERAPWAEEKTHIYLLRSGKIRQRVVDRLATEWTERLGGKEKLTAPVNVNRTMTVGPTLFVSTKARDKGYAVAFLSALIDEHKKEWASFKQQSIQTVTQVLEDELHRLDDQLRESQEEVIEYQRLHDIFREDIKASIEGGYISALMRRRHALETEIMMMESSFPVLRDMNVGVLSDVARISRETSSSDIKGSEGRGTSDSTEELLPDELRADSLPQADGQEGERGWAELRVQLVNLEQQREEMLKNLKLEHTQVRAIDEEIQKVRDKLDLAAKIQMKRLEDRYQALKTQLNALESAAYKWRAQSLLSRQRRAEYDQLQSEVRRFEKNYSTLYERLHDLRVSEEQKAEHYRVIQEPIANPTPVWPDTQKILLVCLALGLGSGFGIALLMQVVDNKVQSINDVERELGVPFLGGVPYWAHSGLEKAIRPIVTEENASGAIEAYRALRTSLVASLGKINEKIVLVTSADSREGKTLTTLNIAIMIAQMNKKVLLVDLDLRRGRLHRSLGAAREPGMTDVLGSCGDLREVVQNTRIEGLSLIPTGSSVDNASELLQSADMVGLFSEIQEDYDYIMVDTSPVLRVTDTVIAATQGLGVVVYVVRVNKTSKPMIQYSLDMLKDSRVLGMIMNSIEMHRLSSLYYAYQYPNYAYYSNAYVYGYNYHHDDAVFDRGGWGSGLGGLIGRKTEGLTRRLRQSITKE